MSEKYVLGIDFGTQSGRTVLVRLSDGAEVTTSVGTYERGVMTTSLPSGKALPAGFAVQDPRDYTRALESMIEDVLQKARVLPKQIVAMGIDTTSSTVLPVLEDGTPLCFLDEYSADPHSWIKIWKHHGAQQEAQEFYEFLRQKAPALSAQFGASSAERMLPKILEVKRNSPKLYESAFTFVELTDWLVWQLTGELQRSAPVAGYKAMWRAETGFLDPELIADKNNAYADIIEDKLPGKVIPMGKAGTILSTISETLGLHPATVIATGHIDAHAAVLGCGVTQADVLVMVMGTSSCHILLNEQLELPEGMSGAVWNGIVEGLYAYESGQSSVGDQFQWFVDNAVPAAYTEASEQLGISIYEYLERLAGDLPMGGTGLLALDWWNGNRSVLNDSQLSGLLLGLTTRTKPEETYLALLESTAFGARRIIESFEERSMEVERIRACGGLAKKNALLVQIYANVLNRTIEVVQSDYTSALGMAIWAGVAAGAERGGYNTIEEAVQSMNPGVARTYYPEQEASLIYDQLYEEYKKLYDYFGRGENRVMKYLRDSSR